MYQLRYAVLLNYVEMLLFGLFVAVSITLVALLIGMVIGLGVAFLRISRNPFLSRLGAFYVHFFRNIPLLLIILFVFFGFPLLGLRGLDKYASAVVAMALYSAAYLAEIFRAGLEAVQDRYVEAAKSIGLSKANTLRYVLMPIMFAEVLPALSNYMISLFKDSSLAAAISVPEITFVGRVINTDTWRVIEAWTAVAGMYLAFGFLIAWVLRRIEVLLVRWR